jgi:hypothetical protein
MIPGFDFQLDFGLPESGECKGRIGMCCLAMDIGSDKWSRPYALKAFFWHRIAYVWIDLCSSTPPSASDSRNSATPP